MSYEVEWTRRAARELLSIERKQRSMVVRWVETNLVGCDNPKAIPGSKQIQGTESGWRYRVGSYRILASIHEDRLLIEVVRVGHRQGVYGNLPKSL